MKKKFWIIEWDCIGDRSKIKKEDIFILPPRIRSESIIEFMRYIYYNSEYFYYFETINFVRVKKHSMIRDEGCRITFGDANPFLTAVRVDDLCIETNDNNSETITWTRPAGFILDNNMQRAIIGMPVKRSFTRNR